MAKRNEEEEVSERKDLMLEKEMNKDIERSAVLSPDFKRWIAAYVSAIQSEAYQAGFIKGIKGERERSIMSRIKSRKRAKKR